MLGGMPEAADDDALGIEGAHSIVDSGIIDTTMTSQPRRRKIRAR